MESYTEISDAMWGASISTETGNTLPKICTPRFSASNKRSKDCRNSFRSNACWICTGTVKCTTRSAIPAKMTPSNAGSFPISSALLLTSFHLKTALLEYQSIKSRQPEQLFILSLIIRMYWPYKILFMGSKTSSLGFRFLTLRRWELWLKQFWKDSRFFLRKEISLKNSSKQSKATWNNIYLMRKKGQSIQAQSQILMAMKFRSNRKLRKSFLKALLTYKLSYRSRRLKKNSPRKEKSQRKKLKRGKILTLSPILK